jgi:chromosome segregation ATPase
MSAKDAQATMNYLDERLLQPLLKAKLVIQQAAELEHVMDQRESQLVDLGKELSAIARKKQEAQDGIEAMRQNLMQQRNELQALIREDTAARAAGLEAHRKEKDHWRDEISAQKAQLGSLTAACERTQKQLGSLKDELSKKLDVLKGLAS